LAEATSLFTSGAVDAFVHWNGLARELWAEGMTSARPLIPTLGQYPFNGVLWIPVQPQHPILAQIFIDWRLSVETQLPDLTSWNIGQKTWLQLHEGLINKAHAEAIPDWISQAYGNLYPSLDQIRKTYWDLDWEYYLAARDGWRTEWQARL
ncbi:MAG TPA: hypothetical protein PK819_03275, partial [Thermomicrobiales bacterium]|nr:hypothetical protein [Thermomicrobiales bacterium]